MLSRLNNIATTLLSTSEVSLVCLEAQEFFSEALTGLKLFISENSCDFAVCHMFVVCFFYIEEQDYLNR